MPGSSGLSNHWRERRFWGVIRCGLFAIAQLRDRGARRACGALPMRNCGPAEGWKSTAPLAEHARESVTSDRSDVFSRELGGKSSSFIDQNVFRGNDSSAL